MSPEARPAPPFEPTVSVVMTTYDGAAFVAKAVASVLDQGHRGLELVVVDDGSRDATPAILAGIAARDDRLRAFTAPHRGIAASRNQGLAMARGRFIAFLDQDDLCPPDRIVRQHARLSAESGLAALFGLTLMFERDEPQRPPPDGPLPDPILTMLISTALFRRDAIDAIGGFDPAYEIADDFDFVLRLIESGQRIEVEQAVGVFYRRHPGQRSADRAATRAECARALQRSLQRRRQLGIAGPLTHPLMRAGSPMP